MILLMAHLLQQSQMQVRDGRAFRQHQVLPALLQPARRQAERQPARGQLTNQLREPAQQQLRVRRLRTWPQLIGGVVIAGACVAAGRAAAAGAAVAGAPVAGAPGRRVAARCFCFRVFFAMNSSKRIRGQGPDPTSKGPWCRAEV